MDMTLEDFILEFAPPGTSDEVIEKSLKVLTAKLAAKLKDAASFIGRVIQRFKGDDGFWVTAEGRRVFVPLVSARKLKSGAARRGKSTNIKENIRTLKDTIRSAPRRAKEAIKRDPIGATAVGLIGVNIGSIPFTVAAAKKGKKRIASLKRKQAIVAKRERAITRLIEESEERKRSST